MISSSVCRACWSGRTLPLASYRGRHKADLPSPNWSRVTRDFMVQFVGIFMGDGCIHASLNRDKTLVFRMAIKLRADDIECLRYIQSVLGGALHTWQRKGKHPTAIWEVTKSNDIRAILEAMRPLVFIRMKKAREIDLALKYFAWRKRVGFHNLSRPIALAFAKKMSSLKKFQVGC